MPKIEVIAQKRVYDEYLKIDEGTVKETSETGEETTYSRFALTRPDAVAVLVYNSDTDEVVLVKQHRYPVDVHGGVDGDLYEIVAGKMDEGEESKETALREVREEIGYDIKEDNMIFMSEYFPSPGYSSEKIYLYAATVTDEDKTSEGGGVEGEHENIEIHNIPATEFFNMIASGEIIDGKTIMGANAFWHLRNDQFVKLGKQYYEALRMQQSKEAEGSETEEDTDADGTSK
jgi:ADP-ribose pyrophosphatase